MAYGTPTQLSAAFAETTSLSNLVYLEEAYYFEAKGNNVVEDNIFPSDIIPNWEPVDKRFKRGNQSVAFQATAFPVVVHTTDWFKEWKDIADPRLKGR